MSEVNVNQNKFPASSVILAMIACMMAFSSGTSYIVEIVSYSRIDIFTVLYAAAYVITFFATVVMAVGFGLHNKGKQGMIAAGSFVIAAAYVMRAVVGVFDIGFNFDSINEFWGYVVYTVTLIVCGVYYITGKAVLGYPVKMVLTVLAISCAAIIFVDFLMHPEGVGDYVASRNMYPFFIYIAFLLYTPFKKAE